MARVKALGNNRFGVVHARTGKVIRRKGKPVIFPTFGDALADARATERRVNRSQPGTRRGRDLTQAQLDRGG